MTLPEGFQFNQGNLQDYLDCQRRFQLRHMLHVAWPSLVSQPASATENYFQRGTTFHYLVRQQLSGVPIELLTASIHSKPNQEENELITWWENYLSNLENPSELGAFLNPDLSQEIHRFPEVTLTAPLAGYRVVAKYDLVTLTPTGTAIILDWKTNRNRPLRHWQQERVQTRIYPYILVKAGKDLNRGTSLQPEHIELRYWFANYPAQPEIFFYSPEQLLTDEAYLSDLIHQIDQKADLDFHLTRNIEHCRYCVYRSLCDRGASAGTLDAYESQDLDEVSETVIPEIQHIDEIEF
jgi:hypothetical protein